ncbi:hypothetical protein AOC36_03295 [Erysipelothrix larvae]|uniref:ATPase BadF/BadG/BcrA/BcrD type domain-containing protein n=1 Tax=Erysipelothrix larvae TaxID=1514105 RepID=A0A0X8GZ21_9FIRM|nr:BadF/BadG/BcrA/BcrD ATPase family protein [Erysipelothrix larvae]AMC93041.1 hypothetical protein AOC36_03295 [Erysipelothrix larvae]
MKHYRLGVDAGGTYTRYAVYLDGDLVEAVTGPSIHFMSVGFKGIGEAIKSGLSQLSQAYPFEKVLFGLAGYGEDQTLRNKISTQVHSVFCDAICINDAQLAHIAALKNHDGIFVISGTGSIALRKHLNQTTRTGGFGYLLDDSGSGFWIGQALLRRFTHEVDGREKRTSVYATIMEAFDLKSGYDIIQSISNAQNTRQTIASVSGLFKTSTEPVVLDIFKEAGYHLACCANALVTEEDDQVKCSCGGSVLIHNTHVRESFVHHLTHQINFSFEPYNACDAVLYI